jgi:hypothetical protein
VAAAGATTTGSVHGKSICIAHAVDDHREGEIMSDEPK